ncbi:MAG: YkoP family protein [Steroidobacteraceae bacterium]
MSVELSEKRGSGLPWLDHAIFRLDGWLRRRLGIFEYSTDSNCIFRLELGRAGHGLALSDGTRVRVGDRLLMLHFWNENVPAMGQEGPTVAWARGVSRNVEFSLRELARYLQQQPSLQDFVALCGDMHLGSTRKTQQIERIVAHYGFEAVDDAHAERRGALHRIGMSILIFMLLAATNPVALRSTVLRRYHRRVFLSRATLERRYRN